MIKAESLFDFSKSSEQDCINYLEKVIWNGKPTSPFDPISKVYKCADKKTNGKYPAKYSRYKCKNTGKYFTIKTNTIFKNSKIPLQKWLWALFIFSSHKKGISSCQLGKDIGVTQKSTWSLLRRSRYALKSPVFIKEILKGVVEIDETYVGGKNKNRHWDKKVPKCQGRSWKDKTPVLVMEERGGNAIAQVVSDVKQKTLESIIRKNVKEGSDVYTDEWHAYKDLKKRHNHETVNHRKKEYSRGKARVSLVENFNSHLLASAVGKQMTYQQLINL